MNNKLIDNSSPALSMVTNLKECFANPNIETIMIATGYWDIPGLALVADELKAFLEREGTKFLLLIGKDPYIYQAQIQNPKYKDANYPLDFIRTDLVDLDVKEEYSTAINLLLDYCTEEEDAEVQIRIFRKNENDETQFLHSKCYIFSGCEPNETTVGIGFIGSSNFTKKGLEDNAELNYLETDPLRVVEPAPSTKGLKTHVQWFKEKWDLSEPWNKTFLEQILKPAPITKKLQKPKPTVADKPILPFTPYELYIKLLQIKFGDIVDKNLGQQLESYLPDSVKRLEYQIDAVKRCISIMHEHGGFMLADVVGLGKTIVGVLIIKYFLCVPQDDDRERKVLVIVPPAIKSGWEKTIALFDKSTEEEIAPYIDFITTGSIGKLVEDEEAYEDDVDDTGDFGESLQEKNYGLIIIDESHKFRNSDTNMYRSLDELIMNIGAETGAYPYIGLLSATPQNNRPNDLKNQIYLFERDRKDSTLRKAEGGDIEKFFAQINKDYAHIISAKTDISEEKRKKKLYEISQKIRDCVLDDILERRTRTDVQKYYADDMAAQNMIFPKISGPHNIKYIMDDELATLFYDTMVAIDSTPEDELITDKYLGYYRYRAIEYFSNKENEIKHKGRGNRGVSEVAKQLATIMRILLVKRLESSFTAFTQSLTNLRTYTMNMIRMWDNNTIFICPDININSELDVEAKSKLRGRQVTFNECVEDIRKKIQKLTDDGKNEKGQNAEYTKEDFKKEYYDLLQKDHELISSLCDRWGKNSEDPKLDAFKENLRPMLFDSKTNTSGKLVIFSEAIDTVKALERAVRNKGFRVLTVTAAERTKLEQTIERNFDANYEGEWEDNYDVLITTEVLAEGVNLHRANVILNYDTPWNATKLMQRIGRVNRIGSKEPCIYVYNFMPSAQGDSMIKLVRKAYTKLQSFHILFGEDSRIFLEEEEIVNYNTIKEIDDEESPMQKYVYELKQYKDENAERYRQIEETSNDNHEWEIASAEMGEAYFIVKSPQGGKLSIRINQNDGHPYPEIISDLDILEEMRVEENAVRVGIPNAVWGNLSDVAIEAYNQYFVRINSSRAGEKRTQAIQIIRDLFSTPDLPQETKTLLGKANDYVRRGNNDFIRKILAIGKELEERKSRLLPIGLQEINDILNEEIGKLLANVERKQGKATVIIGTIK